MQTAKKIWGVATTVLVVILVLSAVFLMGTRLLGYRVYTVISGSMEPEIRVGDLVYVKPVDPSTILLLLLLLSRFSRVQLCETQ